MCGVEQVDCWARLVWIHFNYLPQTPCVCRQDGNKRRNLTPGSVPVFPLASPIEEEDGEKIFV